MGSAHVAMGHIKGGKNILIAIIGDRKPGDLADDRSAKGGIVLGIKGDFSRWAALIGPARALKSGAMAYQMADQDRPGGIDFKLKLWGQMPIDGIIKLR
ncbi:hypothetical protein JCM17846_10680 [Iodidimonas nitroreducens]|uniref:Uncharacterized protein n=1 Tax=Iodidimonas nitroreducens TaxID=1236968 RepID=A0A5A7N8Q4_9PROT|nr:hypothetical protein JCM17846_10680 [Iodidimonas nitroreducens]